jgi:NADPH:quinone reductase-like Zn-dependent oxidoreductase
MTSSSDDKLETVRSHLVDQAGEKAVRLRFHTINYKTNPDWAAEALKITGDVGVDRILEVGGAGTIEASFKAIRQSGVIAVCPRVCRRLGELSTDASLPLALRLGQAIGILTNGEHKEELPNVGALAPYKTTRLQGITIGSRRQLEDMCDALEHGELRPLITKTYAFEDAKEAFQHQWDGGIIGKVVIRVA